MIIKGILVSIIAPFENHMANGGEKLLGNASSIKRRPDGRVYVSGQMQRHVLFSAIDRLNQDDPNKGNSFVSNGDGVTNQIENDLRADMGGFMHPSRGDYSGRRTAPLSVTPAVAINVSEVGRDLLMRLKVNTGKGSNEQALATREYSQKDMMLMNFHLDVTALGVAKTFTYNGGLNISSSYHRFASDEERKRRAKIFLQATQFMNDYANQARNAVCGEPQKVLIVFDSVLSRKACRYFEAEKQEKTNIIEELDQRGAKYFLGDDTTETSVGKVYCDALNYLNDNLLYNEDFPNHIESYSDVFGV